MITVEELRVDVGVAALPDWPAGTFCQRGATVTAAKYKL